jgi:tripeptide aminopeptidase
VFVNQDRLLATLRALLEIESPSGHEQVIARRLASELEALGGEVGTDAAGNVIARFAGEGEPLLLSAHMDTVPTNGPPRIIEANGRWQTDGTTILGADDKVGLAIILEAIRSAGGNGMQHLPLEVVFTVGEEIGCLGAKKLDYSLITARKGICLETGAPHVIGTAAPFMESVEVTIRGRAVHAGASPEKGINAIAVAAEAIAALPWGRLDEETTTNVGMIQGGVASNVVPEMVSVSAEVRSHDEQKYMARIQRVLKSFQDAAARHGATVQFARSEPCRSFKLEDDAEIVRRVLKAAATLGIAQKLRAGGAVSDANEFNERGIKTLVLGAGAGHAHSTAEFIVIADFVRAAELLCTVLKPALP